VITIVIVTDRPAMMAAIVSVQDRGMVVGIVVRQRPRCLLKPRVVSDSTAEQHRRSRECLHRQRQQKQCGGESDKLPLHLKRIPQPL